jgi:hypothetical protein
MLPRCNDLSPVQLSEPWTYHKVCYIVLSLELCLTSCSAFDAASRFHRLACDAQFNFRRLACDPQFRWQQKHLIEPQCQVVLAQRMREQVELDFAELCMGERMVEYVFKSSDGETTERHWVSINRHEMCVLLPIRLHFLLIESPHSCAKL